MRTRASPIHVRLCVVTPVGCCDSERLSRLILPHLMGWIWLTVAWFSTLQQGGFRPTERHYQRAHWGFLAADGKLCCFAYDVSCLSAILAELPMTHVIHNEI
jgi:hypothetical protein